MKRIIIVGLGILCLISTGCADGAFFGGRAESEIFRMPSGRACSVLVFPEGEEEASLRLTASGRFLYTTEVTINGKKVRGWWLIDTGAALSVLDKKHAEALSLPAILDASFTTTASGGAKPYKVESLAIGPVSIENHVIAVVDLSDVAMGVDLAGVIGGDVWGSLPFCIDYRESLLTFYDPATFEPPAGASPVDITLTGGSSGSYPYARPNSPVLRARLNDETDCQVLMDTGDSGSISLFPTFAQQHPDYVGTTDGPRETHATVSGRAEVVPGNIAKLAVLGHSFQAPDRQLVRTGKVGSDLDGIVGWEILKHFRLTFDYRAKTVWTQRQPVLSLAEQLASGSLLPNRLGIRKMTPLHIAAVEGDVEAFELLADAGGHANVLGRNMEHLLHYAAEGGSPEIVAQTLAMDPKAINARSKQGDTPLMAACQHASREVIEQLIEAGATLDAIDDINRTAVHFAVIGRNLPAIDALVEAGADLNVRSTEEMSPLILSAVLGYGPIFKALQANGAQLGTDSTQGLTLLHVAAIGGDPQLVQYILDTYDIDVNARGRGEATPLMVAITYGKHEAMATLLAAGADVDATDRDNVTAVFWAIKRGDVVAVTMLAEAGTDLNHTDGNGMSPMVAAILSGEGEVFKALQAHGAQLGQTDIDGYSILHLATQGGKTEIIQYILDTYDIDVNSKSADGFTPLHGAVQYNHADAVEMLLQAGADPMAMGHNTTPLHVSARKGQIRISRKLIDAGADVNVAVGEMGFTPLMGAAINGHDEIVSLLLQSGASPDVQANGGQTSLHLAVNKGHLWSVQYLIAAGADVNASFGPTGTRPLIMAVALGNEEMVSALLDGGADPTLPAAEGTTAMDLARQKGNDNIVQLLSQKSGT